MPVVGIPVEELKRQIGDSMENDALVRVCQELGCDVEELTELNRVKCQQCGSVTEFTKNEKLPAACDVCQRPFEKAGRDYAELASNEVLRLDLLADRPDNFDASGLARSIRGYLDKETGLAQYETGDSGITVTVDPAMRDKTSYRPYIVCAVVENITFNDTFLKSVMKLQENLHWALGRNRKFASIGVYDLDKVKSKSIRFRPVGPEELAFAALGAPDTSEASRSTPATILKEHPKGTAYAHLLSDLEKYPLLQADNGTVLSMPPIINSEDTRVTIGTKNLFVDVTGLSENMISRALHILITSLKEWDPGCGLKAVDVQYPDKKVRTPNLDAGAMNLRFETCRQLTGLPLSDEEIMHNLEKMRYRAEKDDALCHVGVPAYRHDILHEYDLIEDVAIGYGFKNIEAKRLQDYTVGNSHPREDAKQALRTAMVGLGFFEVLTIMLTSEEQAYEKLRLPVPENRVIIDNPISVDQTIVRTELASNLLDTLSMNTSHELPQKIFETGEIIWYDPEQETGTREELAIAAAIVNSRVGFADIKAVLAALMRETDLAWSLEAAESPLYLEGRSARVLINGKDAGHIGELHPEVLGNFHLNNPVVLFEINLSRTGLVGL